MPQNAGQAHHWLSLKRRWLRATHKREHLDSSHNELLGKAGVPPWTHRKFFVQLVQLAEIRKTSAAGVMIQARHFNTRGSLNPGVASTLLS